MSLLSGLKSLLKAPWTRAEREAPAAALSPTITSYAYLLDDDLRQDNYLLAQLTYAEQLLTGVIQDAAVNQQRYVALGNKRRAAATKQQKKLTRRQAGFVSRFKRPYHQTSVGQLGQVQYDLMVGILTPAQAQLLTHQITERDRARSHQVFSWSLAAHKEPTQHLDVLANIPSLFRYPGVIQSANLTQAVCAAQYATTDAADITIQRFEGAPVGPIDKNLIPFLHLHRAVDDTLEGAAEERRVRANTTLREASYKRRFSNAAIEDLPTLLNSPAVVGVLCNRAVRERIEPELFQMQYYAPQTVGAVNRDFDMQVALSRSTRQVLRNQADLKSVLFSELAHTSVRELPTSTQELWLTYCAVKEPSSTNRDVLFTEFTDTLGGSALEHSYLTYTMGSVTGKVGDFANLKEKLLSFRNRVSHLSDEQQDCLQLYFDTGSIHSALVLPLFIDSVANLSQNQLRVLASYDEHMVFTPSAIEKRDALNIIERLPVDSFSESQITSVGNLLTKSLHIHDELLPLVSTIGGLQTNSQQKLFAAYQQKHSYASAAELQQAATHIQQLAGETTATQDRVLDAYMRTNLLGSDVNFEQSLTYALNVGSVTEKFDMCFGSGSFLAYTREKGRQSLESLGVLSELLDRVVTSKDRNRGAVKKVLKHYLRSDQVTPVTVNHVSDTLYELGTVQEDERVVVSSYLGKAGLGDIYTLGTRLSQLKRLSRELHQLDSSLVTNELSTLMDRGFGRTPSELGAFVDYTGSLVGQKKGPVTQYDAMPADPNQILVVPTVADVSMVPQ